MFIAFSNELSFIYNNNKFYANRDISKNTAVLHLWNSMDVSNEIILWSLPMLTINVFVLTFLCCNNQIDGFYRSIFFSLVLFNSYFYNTSFFITFQYSIDLFSVATQFYNSPYLFPLDFRSICAYETNS